MTYSSPNSMSLNMRHMYDIPDLRGPLPKTYINPNTLAGIIDSNKNFTKFKYILELSGIKSKYANGVSTHTLFVPSDDSLKLDDNFFVNMDKLQALKIVQTATLDKRITTDLLQQSPMQLLFTNCKPVKLCSSAYNGKIYINETVKILGKEIQASNGIIHVTDKLIYPECPCT